MRKQSNICEMVKCSSFNAEENKCSFDDCIFSGEELKIKAEIEENKEFNLFLMKTGGGGVVAGLILLMLFIYIKLGWI